MRISEAIAIILNIYVINIVNCFIFNDLFYVSIDTFGNILYIYHD